MAVKIKKLYSIDSKVVKSFEESCKQNGVEYSSAVEDLMKVYFEKNSQILLDDIYAPRINEMFNRTMEKNIDRIMGVLANMQIDLGASLHLFPAMYKKTMASFENTLDEFINEELLIPDRQSLADEFKVGKEGKQIIDTVRSVSRNEIAERRKQVMKEKREAAAAAAAEAAQQNQA